MLALLILSIIIATVIAGYSFTHFYVAWDEGLLDKGSMHFQVFIFSFLLSVIIMGSAIAINNLRNLIP